MTPDRNIPKSTRTRSTIAGAAQTLFSQKGFAATSMRDIAEKAGCNLALINRYFGSKEALFAEVGQFDLHLPDLRALTPEAAAAQLADHFVTVWEDPERGEKFRVLLRSAAGHDPSAARLRAIFSQQVVAMVAAYRDQPAGVEARAAMLASVILGTAMTRYILRLPHQTDIPPETLSAHVAASLAPIFRAAAEAGQPDGGSTT